MEENKPINILLVEDNETDVKFILRALEKASFPCEVHTAGDGEDALDFIQHEAQFSDQAKFPRPDIILLDINMPKMDGHTFVREIKTFDEYRDIPIIVFTTKEGMEDIFKIEGVNVYINKSMDATDLIINIRKLLQLKY